MKVRLLPATLLLALALPAIAQAPLSGRMSPEEFRAAGLHKLDADELARLEAWIGRTIEVETTQAAETAASAARDEVVREHRGFFSFGTTEPIATRIADFPGLGRGREFTLENGQVWRQVDATTLGGVRGGAHDIEITPSVVGNAWYMRVGRYNARAKVERVR
jgi:hypothetical protein